MAPLVLDPFQPMRPEFRSRLFRDYRAAGKGGQFAKGGGRVPGASRVMSAAEADAWSTGTVWAGPMYHGTSAASADRIEEEGFKLGGVSGYQGLPVDGIWMTPDFAQAKSYARQTGDGREGVVISSRVRVTKVAKTPDYLEAMDRAAKEMPGADERAHGSRATKILQEQGFDGLQSVGGFVVLSPSDIAVVLEETRAKGGQFAKGGGRVPGRSPLAGSTAPTTATAIGGREHPLSSDWPDAPADFHAAQRLEVKTAAVNKIGDRLASDPDFAAEVAKRGGARVESGLNADPMGTALDHYTSRVAGPGGRLKAGLGPKPNPYTVDAALDELSAHTGLSRAQVAGRAYALDTVDAWAQGSAGGDSGGTASIVNQLAAADVYGSPAGNLSVVTSSYYMPSTARMNSDGPLQKAYIKAEYAETQAYFSDRGITSVTLSRGASGVTTTAGVGDTVRVSSNPLSSWTTDSTQAQRFANRSTGPGAAVVQADVPASLIQSTAVTGRGAVNEFEVVVIGSGLSQALVAAAGIPEKTAAQILAGT